MRNLGLGLAGLFLSRAVFAGWAGTGGESFEDQRNPWFLRNVTNVTYCVKIDRASVSASEVKIRGAIQTAIQYWRSQFSAVRAVDPSGIEVGNQSFLEVDCGVVAPDISFIFGYGQLDQEQIDFFKDPHNPSADVTSYIGVSVRTDYDVVNLKAKGFVYIASDFGDHPYRSDGNLIPKAWSKPHLLEYALMHELGHVFGFPHTGTGLMSEVFLDQMLDQHLSGLYQQFPITSFLFPGPVIDTCTSMPQSMAWLGAPSGSNCLRLDLSSLQQIPVYAYAQGSDAPPVQIGAFKGISISVMTDLRSRPGIFLHLTSNQTVFTQQEAGFRAFMVGPSFVDFGAQANYVLVGAAGPKAAYLRFTSDSFTVTAVQGQKLGVMFSYESPLDLLVTHPMNP